MINSNLEERELTFKLAIATISQLLKAIWRGRLKLLSVLILLLSLAASAHVSTSYFIKILMDNIIVPMSQTGLFVPKALLQLIALMIGIFSVGIVASYWIARLMVSVSERFIAQLRNETFSHMQYLSASYLHSKSAGQLMSYYTNDMDALREFVGQSLATFFRSVFTLTFVCIAMWLVSPALAITQWLITLIIVPVVIAIGRRSAKLFKEQQERLSDLNAYVEEMIEAKAVVDLYNYQQQSRHFLNQRNAKLRKVASGAGRNANLVWPMLGNFGYVQYLIIALVGGYLSITGHSLLSLGSVLGFLQLSRTFTFPIADLFMQFNTMMMALAGARRIFTLNSQAKEIDEGQVELKRQQDASWRWQGVLADGQQVDSALRGELIFEQVSFSYKVESPILQNINLHIKAGQQVALVGPTGAGKTTLMQLINRFYEVSSGTIYLDGIDIRHIRKAHLRRSLALVLQESHLFSASISDNLRFAKTLASQEEIETAAKASGAHEFISSLEGAYHHQISANTALSQGQRQLLAITRALVSDAPLLMLDEATSSLDSQSEALVQQGMQQLMHRRTTLVIAHRLSTVMDAHCIVVLEGGKITEQGRHEQLLQADGLYARLIAAGRQHSEETILYKEGKEYDQT